MMAKETDYKAVAQQIIEVVGGPENIISVAHCATRLRLIVKNREIIDDKQVEAIDIVKGCFFTAGQYQIILGTGIVNKVYDEVMKLGIEGSSKNEQAAAAAKRGNKLQQLVRVFADVFVPIIPVMVATGLFMGLRGFLTQDALLAFFGTSADAIPKQFLEFTQILTDTAFGFLPVLVCWSAFKKFGGSPVLGIVIGLMSSLRSQEKNSGIKGGHFMLHLLKYQFLQTIRSRSIMFWALAFPLILGTLFYVSFGNPGLAGSGETDWEPVPVAIVTVESSSANAASFLTFLNETDQDMIDIHSYKTEKAAKKALRREEISGIYYVKSVPSLTIASNGINQSILSSLLDSYEKNADMIRDIATQHPEKLSDALSSLNEIGRASCRERV